MTQAYVGEVRMFAGNFAPVGWMFCEGQLLPISENETLFYLIGTTYGGDGEFTFALPDLRGRVPIHQGNNFILAESGGAEQTTLTLAQIPAHSHLFKATSAIANSASPSKSILAAPSQVTMYFDGLPSQTMKSTMVSSVGGSQPHNNFQPYLCVNFIISLFGIFPSAT